MQFSLYFAPKAFAIPWVSKKRSLFLTESDYSKISSYDHSHVRGRRILDGGHTIVVPSGSPQSVKRLLRDKWRRDPSFRASIVHERANLGLERRDDLNA
jgi:hypothetical protein